MPKVFISYRRQDSFAHAGRLFDRLAVALGQDEVFIDSASIDVGLDFVEEIRRNIVASKALLVVIGPRWLDERDDSGRRRLDDPNDWVLLEISIALQSRVRIIPVLVGGAIMPQSSKLPNEIAPLAQCNAVELRDLRWNSDVNDFLESIRRIVSGTTEPLSRVPNFEEISLDINLSLSVSLEQVTKGLDVTLKVERQESCPECICPKCAGLGQIVVFDEQMSKGSCYVCNGKGHYIRPNCQSCGGTRLIPRKIELLISVPPGVAEGVLIRAAGQGNKIHGKIGDLYARVNVQPHPIYERDGDDLHLVLPVADRLCELGGLARIPCFGSSVEIELPAGTANSKTFRLRGRGVAKFRTENEFGDYYIHILKVNLAKMQPEQRALRLAVETALGFKSVEVG